MRSWFQNAVTSLTSYRKNKKKKNEKEKKGNNERKKRQNLASVAAFLRKAEWINETVETAPRISFWKSVPNIGSTGTVFIFLNNCCIRRPKRIEAVRFLHCTCESWNTQTSWLSVQRPRTECGKTTMNQTTGKAIQFIYLLLHPTVFEHLELLEHRATSTAGKTMLFCVI